MEIFLSNDLTTIKAETNVIKLFTVASYVFSGAPLQGKLPALPANIRRLGWKI
jgi:hypothetical protein